MHFLLILQKIGTIIINEFSSTKLSRKEGVDMNVIAYKETMVDGAGARLSIYTAGCTHMCANCQNPETWDPNQGTDIFEVMSSIINCFKNNPYDGITFSGGDPFFDAPSFYKVLKELKFVLPFLNIWVYTGYTLEEILAQPELKQCLDYIDILVDGPYDMTQPSSEFYKGSTNQRIIDVQTYLQTDGLILRILSYTQLDVPPQVQVFVQPQKTL